MANVLTQNNILDLLESISVRHPSINSFFVGKDWNFTQDTQQLLPALQVYFEEPIMPEGTGINGQGTYPVIIHPLRINIVTWVKNDKTNQRYVLSDAAQVIQNIVNEISTNPFYIRSNAQLTGDINFTELEEFTQSDLGGYGCVLAFRLLNYNSPCGLPQSDIDGYDFPGVVPTSYNYSRIYLTCGTITGCTTFQDYVANAIAQSSSSASLNPTYVGYGNSASGLTGNSNFIYDETLTVQSSTLPAIYGYQASSSPYPVGKLFKAINGGASLEKVLQINRGDGTTVTPNAGTGSALSFGLPDGLGVFTSSEDNVVIGGIYDIQATTAASSRNTAFVVQTQSGGTLANKLKVSYSGTTSYVPFKVEGDGTSNQILARFGDYIYFQNNLSGFANRNILSVGGMNFTNSAGTPLIQSSDFLEFSAPAHFYVNSPNMYFNDTKLYIGTYPHTNTHNFEVAGTTKLSALTASTTVIQSNATNPFAVQTTSGNYLMYYNNTSAVYKTLYINNPDYGSYIALGFIGAANYLQPAAGTKFTIYAAASASRTDFNTDGTIRSAGAWKISNLSATTFSASTIQSDSLAGSGDRMVVTDSNGLLSTQAIPATRIQNGLNTYTGGTADAPTVNISAATLTYLSATTISGETLFASTKLSATSVVTQDLTVINNAFVGGLFTTPNASITTGVIQDIQSNTIQSLQITGKTISGDTVFVKQLRTNFITTGNTYSVEDNISTVFASGTGMNVILPLSANDERGRILNIKNANTGGSIDLVPRGADLLEGVGTPFSIPDLNSVTVQSDGTGNWWII